MNLMFSGDFAKHLLAMTKKDDKLALAMARQFIAAVEPSSIASYLLTVDVAIDLLAARIKKNPQKTIDEIQALPMLETPRKPLGGRKVGRPARSPRGLKKTPAGRRKRRRLSTDQIDKLKNAIVAFLKKNPGSNRKQITAAVSFPSVAAYNRIMSEMKSAKNIVARGEKSKTVYMAKGVPAPKAKKTAAKAKKTAAKAKKAAPRAKKAAPRAKKVAPRAKKAAPRAKKVAPPQTA